jgi:2-hydroxychromene-2-carboxylate isomerase
MSNRAVEFFFDFGSPTTYLAWTQLPGICAAAGATLVYRPMLLGGVFQATGNASPVTIPAKGKYMLTDMARFARRYGVPMQFNPHFPINTLVLMRGAVGVQLRWPQRFEDYVSAMFTAMWVEGRNMGDPVIVAEALGQAGFDAQALLGVPSIAMSLVTGPAEADQGTGPPKWETPMQRGAELVRKLLNAGWPDGVVLNVNFPDCEPEAVKGFVATTQGQRDPDLLRIEDRLDTRGRAYYWVGIERRRAKPPKGTDLWAVRSNLISVTPLCLDFTDESARQKLGKVLDGTPATV